MTTILNGKNELDALNSIFSLIDQWLLHSPLVNDFNVRTTLLGTVKHFCEYVNLKEDTDYAHTIQYMQSRMNKRTCKDVHKAACSLFFEDVLKFTPNGLVIKSKDTSRMYLLPYKEYKAKDLVLIGKTLGNEISIRHKECHHLCELVHFDTLRDFKPGMTYLGHQVPEDTTPMFKYNEWEWNWGYFVWHHGPVIMNCPYNDKSLQLIFEGMSINDK